MFSIRAAILIDWNIYNKKLFECFQQTLKKTQSAEIFMLQDANLHYDFQTRVYVSMIYIPMDKLLLTYQQHYPDSD